MIHGDCREILRQQPPDSVDRVLTGPPFWGPKSWGWDGAIGSEKHFGAYIIEMVGVFRLIRRVLKHHKQCYVISGDDMQAPVVGQPWRLITALEGHGWKLLREAIWSYGSSVPGYEHIHILGDHDMLHPPRTSAEGNCWMVERYDPVAWPAELVMRCLSDLPTGSVVLDPFGGSGIVEEVCNDMELEPIVIEGRPCQT